GALARQARGDPADPLDVRVAVLLREPEALRQMRADGVAVHVLDDRAAGVACVGSCLSLLRLQMNAALELVGARPPAGALLLVETGRPRTGDAADRTVPDLVQRVVGDVVRVDVAPHVLLGPVRQGLDLPDAVAIRTLDLPGVRARGRLLPPDARDPGVVGLERLDQRLDLADVAAAVGIRLPEVRPLDLVLLGDRHHLGPDQRQAVALDQPPA